MVDRRDLLKSGALLPAGLNLGASTAGGALATPAGPIQAFATIEELAASGLAPGRVGCVIDAARGGVFTCVAGPVPSGDPLYGLHVPAADGRRHFARLWDGRVGRPEWFGAIVNDGIADCAPAIEACVELCPITELSQADYFVARTVVINQSWRTVRGSGVYVTDRGQGTRIILSAGAPGVHDADVLLVGSLRQPARRQDGFPFEIHVSNLALVRDGPCAPPSGGDLRRYPSGLRASYLTRCSFAGIASLESSVGFYLGGLVYTKFDDCMAQRDRPAIGSGADLAVGFYLDGTPDFGLAGGNASLYLNRCLAVGQAPGHVRPTGLIAEGAFVDTFVDGFESAQIDNGMRFSARGAGKLTQTVDLHVRNCVLDGCGGTGLEFDLTGTETASVDLADPYVYASGGGGRAGIVVRDGGGMMTITGGQVHGSFGEGSLLLSNTRGIRVQGLKLHEGSRPVVIDRSGALQVEPQIMNQYRSAAGFAVSCSSMYRSSIRPMVLGAPGKLGGGVQLDIGCNYASVDTSAIDQGCFVQVDAGLKLRFGAEDALRGAGAAAFARAGNVAYGVSG